MHSVRQWYRDVISKQHPAQTWTTENVRIGLELLAHEFDVRLESYTVYGNMEVKVVFKNDPRVDELCEFLKGRFWWRTGELCYGYHKTTPSSWFWVQSEGQLHAMLVNLPDVEHEFN
jgi:hypothetical protein